MSKDSLSLPIAFETLLRTPVARFGAGALTGILLVACFPLLHWHALVWVACLPLLLALLSETRVSHGFFSGYVTGVVFWMGSCYWFVDVLEKYGALSRIVAVGALALFVVVFSVFFGAYGLVLAWASCRSRMLALTLAPLLWVSMEFARTHLITGFPWNLLGYAVAADGLRQVATVTAVYGLSFLATCTGAVLVWVVCSLRKWRAWITLAGWLALLVAGNGLLRPPPLPPPSNLALLVQPNVPLDVETLERHWLPWRNREPLDGLVTMTLGSIKRLSQSDSGRLAGARPGGPTTSPILVVWAENPAPFYFTRDLVFRSVMGEMARKAQAYVVFNTVTYTAEEHPRPKNSAILLDPTGRLLLQYDKIHLVPFGEYVPEWAFPSKVGKITFEAGAFVPGTRYEVARTPQGSIGILICYEAIFPGLVRRLVPPGPGVLVNISNDAWYGDSSAAPQHLEMARLRAIENRRYLLRATNDGITALIDPYGRVVARLPRHQAAVLEARFGYLAARSFYTSWGDVFAWLCVVASACLLGVVLRRPVQGIRHT